MRIRSHAKINWTLRVVRRRDDGYHDLETIFQTIDLHDVLSFERADRLTLTCDDPTIPVDDTNLVIRAARALGAPPVAISLQKRIPAGGGLGGGSSNAAATLVALDELFAMNTPRERLHEIALFLGSDVPFFLIGGTAYATGRGEVLTPVRSRAGVPLLLVLPEERVSTAEAFRSLTRLSPPQGMDPPWINDFEEPVFARLPHLRDYKQRLLDAGAFWAAMTGSGSTIVGAFRDERARDAALTRFSGVRVAPSRTV